MNVLRKKGIKILPEVNTRVQTAEEGAKEMVCLGKAEALKFPAKSLGFADDLELPRAAFVEELALNLLSVSDLMMAGWSLHFVSNHLVCVMTKGDSKISIQMTEGLFPVMLNLSGGLKCDESTMRKFHQIMRVTEHALVAASPPPVDEAHRTTGPVPIPR